MKLAGDNRHELEKVLEHYSSCKGDSLKYKAAVYLIENMPGHRCICGPDAEDYYREIQPILRNEELDWNQKMNAINMIAEKYPPLADVIKEDIKVITSDYLIENIDAAFRQWESPVADYLTFSQFCEWLLPYKIAEFQPLDFWRDTLSQMFIEKLSSDIPNDENYYSPYIRHTGQTQRPELP